MAWEQLNEIWEVHKGHLRWLLIDLSRDIDLTDDLLQETYLRAHLKLSTYRGGDARAWLSTIARSVFYNHYRTRHADLEEAASDDQIADPMRWPGSHSHVAAMTVREVVSELSPPLRSALLLRYYGGYSYAEIADQLACKEATVRQNVWRAVSKLKAAFPPVHERGSEMRCADLKGTRMLDCLCGALATSEIQAVAAHIARCAECARDADELRRVINALDDAECEFRATRIVELDARGVPTSYTWGTMNNDSGQIMETAWWGVNNAVTVEYAAVQGEPVQVERSELSDTQFKVVARLPKPVQPGYPVDMLLVTRLDAPDYRAEEASGGRWRYYFRWTPNSDKEWVATTALRLPAGARLLHADPPPTRIRANATTTVTWRCLLPKVQAGPDGVSHHQFVSTVEYSL